MYNNLTRCNKTNTIFSQGPQGPQGTPGAIGFRGYDGSTGPTGPQGKQGIGCRGVQGAQGKKGEQGIPGGPTGNTGPAFSITSTGLGSIVLKNSETTVYNDVLSVSTDPSGGFRIDICGNIVPSVTNVFSLGTKTLRFQDAFIGPGSINIAGQNPSVVATIGSNDSGIAYSQFGFATPFLNIGPEIGINKAVGGWKINATVDGSNNPLDLIAQANIHDGVVGPYGPTYSLIFGKYGPTGPTGNTGITGTTGTQGSTGITGPAGISNNNIIVAINKSGWTGATGYYHPATGPGSGINQKITICYYLDSVLLPVTTTKANQSILLNGSFQTMFHDGTPNVAATFYRDTSFNISNFPTSQIGQAVSNTAINLATGVSGEIFYANDTGPTYLGIATSLWLSSSTSNAATGSPNGQYAFFQTIDIIPTPGTYYYIIRISVDNNAITTTPQNLGIYYLPIKMSALLLN